ncbi:MAG: efflux RND transporter periplasmic adaptor subunit [Planctomycetes bacterium]|nr:efflux RND transporter periplasmic adaptor subunit [Planctomycetota bacterium]
MITKFGLPLLAVVLIAFAVSHLAKSRNQFPELPPPIQPATSPFPNTVAGVGMIEPQTENISIGSPVPGVVVEVLARVGQRVQAGDPLFRLDDRKLQAELTVRQAMRADATASLERLAAMPRPEELPPAEAAMREAEADYDNLKQQWARGEKLVMQGAMPEEEFAGRKLLAFQARERFNRATANLDLLKAGAWEYDQRVEQAAVEQAQAQVKQTEIELERLVVRALVDGDVLQVNVRPGEFVGTPPSQALVVLGNVTQLHVRVDIDEYDIPRFVPEAPARATLKGQPDNSFPLRFVRIEPYVVPKKSLTGDNTERVDVRVLQVIYAIDAGERRLFVGQQLDVFIDASAAESRQSTAEVQRQ